MENFSEKYSFKIALLSSFVTTGLAECLTAQFKKINIPSQFYLGPYNQYAQEMINDASELYRFQPDVLILFVDFKTLAGDFFFLPYRLSAAERRDWIKKTLTDLVILIGKAKSRFGAKILVHNFEVPTYSPIGILEHKEEFGFIEAVEELNKELRQTYKDDKQVFIFDYNALCSKIGKDHISDPKLYYLGDIKLGFNNFSALSYEYMSFIKPMLTLSKKCIVMDLDNTLWGGVIGEDGIGGIKLGPTPAGRPFLEFQKYLLALHERGVLLAINSKNNPTDALQVLREHPNMILKEECFASIKINWQDKITNLKEIAKEINIGLDSLLFIDDDGATRELVRDFLPEVTVVDFPEDPALYPTVLMQINDFNTLQITEEDKKRNEMYRQEKKRATLLGTIENFTDFIKSLDLKVTMMPANNFTIPRISQLTQKTNQFNVTTRRYNEEQIAEFAKSEEYLINCFQVEDRFGDYGITGVVIIKKEQVSWRIDTFLLSCRVLGKNVEFAIMSAFLSEAKNHGIKKIFADFVPTVKNKPAENFYRDCGFQKIGTLIGKYLFDISKDKFSGAMSDINFVKSDL